MSTVLNIVKNGLSYRLPIESIPNEWNTRQVGALITFSSETRFITTRVA